MSDMIECLSPYTDNWDPERWLDSQHSIVLVDHLGVFDAQGNNDLLHRLQHACEHRGLRRQFFWVNYLEPWASQLYPNLDIRFDLFKGPQHRDLYQPLKLYQRHPSVDLQNFVCSFNGAISVGRQFLVSALHRRGWLRPGFSSKNFAVDPHGLDGSIQEVMGHDPGGMIKQFIFDTQSEFWNQCWGFGHLRFDHGRNIYNLQSALTQSFVHVVSETMSSSHHPYVTEKFLYSVVTRGLFVAYAQPGWHQHLEAIYGFRPYQLLFDYGFDNEINAVRRLIRLLDMLSKYEHLSTQDWHDLYALESDTIEYNYDHFMSGEYERHVRKWIDT